jgi:CheY-like chemotaxis protein
LNDQRSVLIVDRSEETREVLQAVLQRRGLRTLAAERAQKGLELARQHHPDLIVLDLDLEDTPAEQFSALPCGADCGTGVPPASAQTGETPAPQYHPRLVLLGSLRGLRNRLPEGEFVSKPYHYAPLIRKIEELLREGIGPVSFSPAEECGPCRRCSSSAEPTRAAASS